MFSARLHIAPRKRMQRPPVNVTDGRGRVSVMLGEEPGLALLVQEKKEEVSAHPRRRSPFPWRGLTMFVREGEEMQGSAKVYVQQGESFYETEWPSEREARAGCLQGFPAENEGQWEGVRPQVLRPERE